MARPFCFLLNINKFNIQQSFNLWIHKIVVIYCVYFEFRKKSNKILLNINLIFKFSFDVEGSINQPNSVFPVFWEHGPYPWDWEFQWLQIGKIHDCNFANEQKQLLSKDGMFIHLNIEHFQFFIQSFKLIL